MEEAIRFKAKAQKKMAEEEESAPLSPPLPKRGAYNFDFDNLDDIDPFAPKKTLLNNSPPIRAAAPISQDNFEDIADPFKSRGGLSSSPPGSKSVTDLPSPPVDDKFADVDDPFKSSSALSSSPPGKLTPSSLPIDEFAEVEDPFKSKSGLSNSPPGASKLPPPPVSDFDETEDPFKSKKALSNSPPTRESSLPPPPNEFAEIEDPFKSKRGLSNSPPGESKFPPPPIDDFNDVEDPFKSKKALSNSPPIGSSLPPPPVEDFDDIDPFKPKTQMANSPPGSPRALSNNNNNKVSEPVLDVPKKDSADVTPGEEPVKQEIVPKKKRVLKKPKVQSKFKPPKNFKKKQEEDIQIFMPGVEALDAEKPQPDTKTQTEMTSDISSSNAEPTKQDLPDVVNANESPREKSGDEEPPQDSAPDALAEPPHDASPAMSRRDQNFLDREGSEEHQAANEGYANSLDADKSTNLMEMSTVREDQRARSKDDSLLTKFDPLKEKLKNKKKSSKSSVSPREHGLHSQSEHDLLMNSPPAHTDKHPAARALEAEVGDTTHVKRSSTMDKPQKEIGDNPGQVVQLVQVLRYSQTDWNKLKQEMELSFQTSLLNKERDWSLLLGDRDKKLGFLEETNKKLKRTNDDMRMVVAEFEKTISQLQAEKEKNRTDSSKALQTVEQERDQALEDLASVETAFSDLHRRYEKSKTIIEGFKRNEEQLKQCVSELQEKCKKSEVKLQALKSQAEEKLDRANDDIEKIKKTSKSDVVRLEAAVKKADLRINGLEDSLQRKEKENAELTAICDELIAKVGS